LTCEKYVRFLVMKNEAMMMMLLLLLLVNRRGASKIRMAEEVQRESVKTLTREKYVCFLVMKNEAAMMMMMLLLLLLKRDDGDAETNNRLRQTTGRDKQQAETNHSSF
jgi:hypothetical protein